MEGTNFNGKNIGREKGNWTGEPCLMNENQKLERKKLTGINIDGRKLERRNLD